MDRLQNGDCDVEMQFKMCVFGVILILPVSLSLSLHFLSWLMTCTITSLILLTWPIRLAG